MKVKMEDVTTFHNNEQKEVEIAIKKPKPKN
jgi:hypothetical protein